MNESNRYFILCYGENMVDFANTIILQIEAQEYHYLPLFLPLDPFAMELEEVTEDVFLDHYVVMSE